MVRDEDGDIEAFPAGPGDVVSIPEGTEHAFLLDEASKRLRMDLQPGFECYLLELGTPHPDDELLPESGPTGGKLAETAETPGRCGMDVAVPPPER